MRKFIIKNLIFAAGLVFIGNLIMNGGVKAKQLYDHLFDFPFAHALDIKIPGQEPIINAYEVTRELKGIVTAYNVGVPGQTDSTPCIAANGENSCTAIALGYKRCANNCEAFGTRAYIEGYGECIVTDRMNSRFDCDHWDVAMPSDQIKQARAFGAHERGIRILK